MLVLLSPAKSLTQHPVKKGVEATQPEMIDQAEYLVNKLKKYSKGKIKKLMGVSDDIATLNFQRFQDWSLPFTEENAWMAGYSFDGAVYWGLDASSMTKKEMEWADDHVRILSGLYGVLKPTNRMFPYRLEMGTRLPVTKTKTNLYKYWGDQITDLLNEDLSNSGSDIVVNLASNEYFKSVNTKKLEGELITPVFKDFSNGEYKSLMTYAKKARGLMARYIVKNKIKEVEKLKGFDYEGYTYNDRFTDGNTIVFTRDKVPGKLK